LLVKSRVLLAGIAPLFLTLIVVIAFARLIGFIFRKLGQPSVMGEVLGGIILGPSVFGFFFPGGTAFLFHQDALVFLRHVAELGISLYLFVMGLEINLPRLQKAARSALLISQFSIIFPFALGLLLASQIYTRYAPAGFGLFEFSIFIGVSLSVTAFPVLARILADSPLHKTRLGDLALTCAAIDDIAAWCLVAIVTGFTAPSLSGAWMTLGLTVGYVIIVMGLARPIVQKLVLRLDTQFERLPEALLAFAVLGALISATITDAIGIHGLFGAFLFGAIIPHDSLIARDVSQRLQDFVRILFLPAFFALTGMKTQIGLLSGGSDWAICAVIIGVAILGKFGGAYLGAILAGNSRREATILGILLNTRGLVELIVLNIGLSLGILTPPLFTMLVLMALVTTFMAGPLLRLVAKV
jgi:Kef-type K+ transport system membrane component KefB